MWTNLIYFLLASIFLFPAPIFAGERLHLPFAGGQAEITGLEEGMLGNEVFHESLPILGLATSLQEVLIARGYVFSKVLVANHDKLLVLPGRISRIEIEGLSPKAEKQARSYMEKLIGDPLQLESLDRALSLVGDLSGVEASVTLARPEPEIDDGVLTVRATEQWQSGAIAIDSLPRSIFQRNRFTLTQRFHTLFQGGDMFRVNVVHLRGDGHPNQYNFAGTYRAPVTSSGAYVELNVSDLQSKTNLFTSDNRVQQRNFDGRSYSLAVGYPEIRFHDRSRYWIVSVERTEEDTQGFDDNTIDIVRLILFGNKSDQEGHAESWNLTLSLGNANHHNPKQDGGFFHVRAGYGKIMAMDALGQDTEIRAEGYLQYSNDIVPNSEIFYLGSESFLRGYAPASFTGSRGGVGTLEIAKNYFFENSFLPKTTPYIFYDLGYINNQSRDTLSAAHPKNKFIHSVGLGNTFYCKYNIQANIWGGLPLKKNAAGNRLSPAVYLNLSKGW